MMTSVIGCAPCLTYACTIRHFKIHSYGILWLWQPMDSSSMNGTKQRVQGDRYFGVNVDASDRRRYVSWGSVEVG